MASSERQIACLDKMLVISTLDKNSTNICGAAVPSLPDGQMSVIASRYRPNQKHLGLDTLINKTT